MRLIYNYLCNLLGSQIYRHMMLKFTKFSVSFFLKKLNMMRNYYERLDEVVDVNIQLFMQSRICTTYFVNIYPIVLKLCCVEQIS